jgi:hypothetical protein
MLPQGTFIRNTREIIKGLVKYQTGKIKILID